MPENGVFSYVPFCLWSLGRFERCVLAFLFEKHFHALLSNQWSIIKHVIVPFCSLPANPSSWFETLKRLLELKQHPSRALALALCIAFRTSETQEHRQVCFARHYEGLEILSKTIDVNLAYVFVDNTP